MESFIMTQKNDSMPYMSTASLLAVSGELFNNHTLVIG